MSHVVTVVVMCDGEDDCQAEFESYLAGEDLATDAAKIEQRILRQAHSRGWVVTKPEGVRQRFVCPLHVRKGKRRQEGSDGPLS